MAQKHYTVSELYGQIAKIKEFFPEAISHVKCGKAEIIVHLKPTINSEDYTVKFEAKQGIKKVKVFVVHPRIEQMENGKRVPHLYADGSLCLYMGYPQYHEWDYKIPWTETLIPWTSLWLFYYEIWRETGNWLGGGIHGKKNIPPM